MNKIIITLIMLLASISFSEVNTTYKDGTDCNCDSITINEDILIYETPYVNGKKNGIVKMYFPNGSIKGETPYVNDKKNGVENVYHEDGSIAWELLYINGKKNGIGKGYYEDGILEREIPYVNGKENGIEKWYYEDDGSLEWEALYEHGNQKWRYDYEDGYKHCSNGRIGKGKYFECEW